ncbi:MAG: hypothetical protein H0V36_00965, partial [Chloroflexi bacterium]|nr:hypothetical protein [Chloroflexota bacterium]
SGEGVGVGLMVGRGIGVDVMAGVRLGVGASLGVDIGSDGDVLIASVASLVATAAGASRVGLEVTATPVARPKPSIQPSTTALTSSAPMTMTQPNPGSWP